MSRNLESLGISVTAVFALWVLAASSLPAQQQGGGDGMFPPMPCGMECMQAAMEAGAACKEAGGSLMDCMKASMDALAACRAEAGCETPVLPPVCGEDCLIAARDAARACHDAGGDMWACMLEVKTQLRACLDAAGCDVPVPPEMPAPCASCLKDSIAAARDCLQNGGNLRDCAVTFRGALEACREAAGCSQCEPTPEDPPAEGDQQVLGLVLEQTFVRGDVSTDGAIDVSDAVSVLRYLFVAGAPPSCLDSADASDDGSVDIADPILILRNLFLGTASIPAPCPVEGFDPTEDAFTCGIPTV